MKYVIKVKLANPVSQEERKELVADGFDVTRNGLSVTGLSEDFDSEALMPRKIWFPILNEILDKVENGDYEWL